MLRGPGMGTRWRDMGLDAMKAELVPLDGGDPIVIQKDVTVIGRRREMCDVEVNDPSLSKRHCVVVKTDGLLVIRDLASTNGTSVKGQKIRWAALLPEDKIALGSRKFRVYLGPDEAISPSEALARRRAKTNGPAPSAQPVGPPPGLLGLMPAPGNGFAAPSPLGTPSVAPGHPNYLLEDDATALSRPGDWPSPDPAPSPFESYDAVYDDDELIPLDDEDDEIIELG